MSNELTLEQIKTFEQALADPRSASDPNWQITKQLLQLAVLQGREIINLRAELDAYIGAYQSSQEEMIRALRLAGGAEITHSPAEEAETKAALASLEEAINAYENGQQIATYAGSALKFVAKLALPII